MIRNDLYEKWIEGWAEECHSDIPKYKNKVKNFSMSPQCLELYWQNKDDNKEPFKGKRVSPTIRNSYVYLDHCHSAAPGVGCFGVFHWSTRHAAHPGGFPCCSACLQGSRAAHGTSLRQDGILQLDRAQNAASDHGVSPGQPEFSYHRFGRSLETLQPIQICHG